MSLSIVPSLASVRHELAEGSLPLPQTDGADDQSNDIPARHWQGGEVDCSVCPHAALRLLAGRAGCAPSHACMQDVYARRIDRFFRWHPELAAGALKHPYFEVRAIAARYADQFQLPPLMLDPDETVRLQVAMRVPLNLLVRLVRDPHREVRLRVALRLPEDQLGLLRDDPDYGVREIVARRLPAPLLSTMLLDKDRSVRMQVARRIAMPALLRLATDREPEVRCIVAERLPEPLLPQLAEDPFWRVRWTVAQRCTARAVLARLAEDADPEVRAAARERSGPMLVQEDPSHV